MLTDKYRMNLMGDLKSIILATDGSPFSDGAINEALNFARACQTVLTVLRVLEFNPEFETIGHKYVEQLEEAAAKHFEDVRARAADMNVECDIVIRRSEQAYEAIVEEAKKRRTDIIIMGRRGRTGLSRLVIGSQTAKTIAYAPCKILVVPKDTEIKGEAILLATDGSKYSEYAEMEAVNMANRCPFVKQFVAMSVASTQEKKSEAEKNLLRVKANAEKRGVKLETLTLIGEPYKVIVNASLESGADIVIMGTHGRTGIQRLIMGSVAERVVALSKCSVLVTKEIAA
ncbi:MAG: universal stress protein [Candidatus Magnetoovum sp. WYHC-5]|nr:universal stress protein [Candidatus Magnetoovum sp. WYHC-5]